MNIIHYASFVQWRKNVLNNSTIQVWYKYGVEKTCISMIMYNVARWLVSKHYIPEICKSCIESFEQ